MSETTGVVNTVDSALASYGRTKTYMSTIYGSSFLTLFLFVGLFILYKAIKNKNNYESIEAKILSIRPTGENSYSANVTYTILDKSYESDVKLNYYRNIGSYVTIYYDRNNPYTTESNSPSYNMFIGLGLVVGVLSSCAFMSYNTYMVKNSDIAAQDAAFSTQYGRRYNRPLFSLF